MFIDSAIQYHKINLFIERLEIQDCIWLRSVSVAGPLCQSLWMSVEQQSVENGLEPGQN